MSDDARRDLEWPSEDLAQSRAAKEPRPDLEWPSEDAGSRPATPEPAAAPTAAPEPAATPPMAPEPAPAPPAAPEPAATPPKPEPVSPAPIAPPVQPTTSAGAWGPTAAVPEPAGPVQPRPEPAWPDEPRLSQASREPWPAPPAEPVEAVPPASGPTEPVWQADVASSMPAWNQPEPGREPQQDWPQPQESAPAQWPQPQQDWPQPQESAPAQWPQPQQDWPQPAAPADSGFGVPSDYQQLPGGYPERSTAYGDPEAYQPQPYAAPAPYPPEVDPFTPAQPMPPPFAVSGAVGPYSVDGSLPGSPGGPHDAPADEGRRRHFRPDIEGLRAVAIVAVLLFHIGLPLADGGFVGVDVFYVISGFLITGLLIREGEESGRIDLLRFYARRMRRLLPAALLVIVVTLALSAVIVTPLELLEVAGDAAASALYVANFRFALEATDYLAVEAPSPLLHYWSLGVEEQFYLVWPLLLLLATRLFSLRWVGLFLLVLAAGSFGLSLYWTEADQAWAFYSPVTRAWELAAGALVAVGLLRIPRRVPGWAGNLAVVLGLVLIVLSVVGGSLLYEAGIDSQILSAILITPDTAYPGMAAILPVLGAVLVIVGGGRGPTITGRVILGNPLSRYLGRISYSLYLWHWPLLILVPIALDRDELPLRLGLAGLAVVLAALSTEIVERPFRRSSYLAGRSGASVRLGLVGSVAVGLAALMMSGAVALPSNIPVPWLRPDPVVVELAGVRDDLPRHYDDGCQLTYKQKKLRTDCVYGDPDGEQTAMLIGDSHAAQWMPALDPYAARRGWRLEVHTKSACAVTDVPVWERRLARDFDECIEWREALVKHIRKTAPAAIFVGLSRDYDLWDAGRVVQSRQATGYWQQKLAELLTTLGETADRVVLLAETPFFNFDPIDCLEDPDIGNCDPPRSRVVDAGYAELETAATQAAGAELISANDLLCPGTYCPAAVDGAPVFRDNHHVTASYMERLATPIGRMLDGKPPYPDPSPSPLPGAAEAAS